MRLSMSLCLPRDNATVAVLRRVVRSVLHELHVTTEVTADIVLALSEACSNVLDHAGRGDQYDVSVTITADQCELRVIDVGHGFDHTSVMQRVLDNHDLDAERGRGLMLMRAVVDQIELLSQPESGTLVRLVKQLRFRHQ